MALQRITLALFLAVGASNSFQANPAPEQWSRKSIITLTDRSEVPGLVLEPGTYVLRADEAYSAIRTTIQVLNADESQVLATFIAVPDHERNPDYDTAFTYFDGITDGPKPIHTWYYPGEMNGFEFVYSKARAKEIAKSTDDYVMASDSREGEIVAITSNGTEVPVFDSVAKIEKRSRRHSP
jgi:hypothetical protein